MSWCETISMIIGSRLFSLPSYHVRRARLHYHRHKTSEFSTTLQRSFFATCPRFGLIGVGSGLGFVWFAWGLDCSLEGLGFGYVLFVNHLPEQVLTVSCPLELPSFVDLRRIVHTQYTTCYSCGDINKRYLVSDSRFLYKKKSLAGFEVTQSTFSNHSTSSHEF